MICPGSYLEHLNVFSQTFLFIAGKLNIGGQFFFLSAQRICEQIIKAFVSCFVLINVSDEYFNEDVPVLERTHIFFEIFCCIEKTAGTLFDLIIDPDIGADIVPVRIKDKSNLLYLTGRDDFHQVFRKGTVKTEILYTADCD